MTPSVHNSGSQTHTSHQAIRQPLQLANGDHVFIVEGSQMVAKCSQRRELHGSVSREFCSLGLHTSCELRKRMDFHLERPLDAFEAIEMLVEKSVLFGPLTLVLKSQKVDGSASD